MDISAIDSSFQRVQGEVQQIGQALTVLANKLQAQADRGDMNAREWLLDLKGVALAIQAEQNEVNSLLQNLHGFAGQAAAAPAQAGGVTDMLGGLLGSNFGRAITNGMGFGIGTDLINGIFKEL